MMVISNGTRPWPSRNHGDDNSRITTVAAHRSEAIVQGRTKHRLVVDMRGNEIASLDPGIERCGWSFPSATTFTKGPLLWVHLDPETPELATGLDAHVVENCRAAGLSWNADRAEGKHLPFDGRLDQAASSTSSTYLRADTLENVAKQVKLLRIRQACCANFSCATSGPRFEDDRDHQQCARQRSSSPLATYIFASPPHPSSFTTIQPGSIGCWFCLSSKIKRFTPCLTTVNPTTKRCLALQKAQRARPAPGISPGSSEYCP